MADNTWRDRFRAVSESDGEAWDELHERLESDWKNVYRREFCRYAEDRGWNAQNALEWAVEVEDDAFDEAFATDYDPVENARASVRHCEEDAEHA